ncbi:hypothetical protein ABK040_007885 [Willaertia magna]
MMEGIGSEIKNIAQADDLVNDLIDWAYENGIKKFVEAVDPKTLRRAMEEAKVTNLEDNLTREQLEEKFLDNVEADEGTLEGFLQKMKIETLKHFVKKLDFETDASNIKQYAEDIADEILLNGTRMFITKCKKESLLKAAEQAGIKVKSSFTKTIVEDHILNEAFPGIVEDKDEEEEEEEEKVKKGSKNKKNKKSSKLTMSEIKKNRPKLAKGITFDEIFQNYWADELKQFCKDHGVKYSGKKNVIIKRILDYLEDPTKTGHIEKKRKRKSAAGAGKKKTKQKDSSKKNKKEDGNEEEKEENGENEEHKEESESKEEKNEKMKDEEEK